MTEPQKDYNRYCNVSVCCANIDGICGAALELCGTHSSLSQPAAQWTDEEVMKQIEEAFDRGISAAEATIDMQKPAAPSHSECYKKGYADAVANALSQHIDCVKCLEEDRVTMLEHDSTIRNQTIDEIIKPATDENKKDGWTLNVKWLVKIRDELPPEGETICLEDIEFVLLALNKSLRPPSTQEQP